MPVVLSQVNAAPDATSLPATATRTLPGTGLAMMRVGYAFGQIPATYRGVPRRRSGGWAPTWMPTTHTNWGSAGGSFGGGGSSWGGFGGGSSGGGGASGGW